MNEAAREELRSRQLPKPVVQMNEAARKESSRRAKFQRFLARRAMETADAGSRVSMTALDRGVALEQARRDRSSRKKTGLTQSEYADYVKLKEKKRTLELQGLELTKTEKRKFRAYNRYLLKSGFSKGESHRLSGFYRSITAPKRLKA